jgi:hypothetical protein
MNIIMMARPSRASEDVEMFRLHAEAPINAAPMRNPRTAAIVGVDKSTRSCTVLAVPVRYLVPWSLETRSQPLG